MQESCHVLLGRSVTYCRHHHHLCTCAGGCVGRCKRRCMLFGGVTGMRVCRLTSSSPVDAIRTNSLHVCVYVSYLPACLPACLSVCLSAYLPVCLRVCLPVCSFCHSLSPHRSPMPWPARPSGRGTHEPPPFPHSLSHLPAINPLRRRCCSSSSSCPATTPPLTLPPPLLLLHRRRPDPGRLSHERRH